MAQRKPDGLSPPAASVGDVAHAIAKNLVSAIPVVGSTTAELVSFVLGPPLETRRDEWMHAVAEAIRRLQRRGLDAEKLRTDPRFVDAVLSCCQIWARTSQTGKREALRNALFNSALPTSPTLVVQQLFISQLDSFTEWHILVLELLSRPRATLQRIGKSPPNLHSGPLLSLIYHAYPELAGRELAELLVNDLIIRGMLPKLNASVTMTGTGMLDDRNTDLGRQFIAFISATDG